ncbi:MAG: prolyl oligopeptidase family serine peptidase [Porphyrobacter sp.]|nr:prolyl oligopeptidase family serine peptidase [Porphyrobacter sp.]
MQMSNSIDRILRGTITIAAATALVLGVPATGQAPAASQAEGPPRFPMRMEPDPRVQQRTYHFADTNEDLAYTVFVSSKVKPGIPAPLIVALHGYGGDSNFIVRGRLVDLAEENGYIVVGPMGYSTMGWYGSPVIVLGKGAVEPPNLPELSEKDVMNVLAMARREFSVDPDKTYLMGHSMGGAGTLFLGQKHASEWAAIAAIAPAAFMMQPNQKAILAPIKAAGLPLMITQGDKDPVVPATNTRTWAAAMDELGMPHEYIEMPDRDHGTIIADGMPDIFRFFAQHTRGK